LKTPHSLNPFGWRQFFKNRDIGEIHLFDASIANLSLLAAAVLGKIPVHVHLTGWLNPPQVKFIHRIAPAISRFHCPAEGIVRQLRDIRISQEKINFKAPSLAPRSAEDPRDIIARRRHVLSVGAEPQAPLLLALETFCHPHPLKLVAWAAALIRHTRPGTTLVVADPCPNTRREEIEHWQRIWKTPDLITVVPADQWDNLAAACDLILTADPRPADLIRHFRTQQVRFPLVAPNGLIHKICPLDTHVILTHSPRPRLLATAVLNRLTPLSPVGP
jgi:hypothetical protein